MFENITFPFIEENVTQQRIFKKKKLHSQDLNVLLEYTPKNILHNNNIRVVVVSKQLLMREKYSNRDSYLIKADLILSHIL